MSYGKRILAEPLQSLAFGSIGSSYVAIGNPFANPIRILVIKNSTDVSILFSYDGSTDNEILLLSSGQVLDLTSNKVNPDGSFFSQNTTVFAKEGPDGAPTKGAVYVSAYYGQGD